MKSKIVEFNTERAVEIVTPTTCLMIWGNDFHYTKNQRSREPKIEDQGDKGSRGRRIEGKKENI
jgi:hypothetical protein